MNKEQSADDPRGFGFKKNMLNTSMSYPDVVIGMYRTWVVLEA